MVVKAVKITLESLGLTFETGDQKLESLIINGGARDRTSNATFSVIDHDLSIADKVYQWSRKNGGIKIPQELRGSKTVQSSASNGGSGASTPVPGATTNGAKLEGLENEIVEVSSYMDVIAWCEGTYPDGYNIMFTGATFSDFSDHPRQIQGGGGLSSDAAGRYQFLSTTWDSVAGSLGLTDFSPKSQNIAGWQLAKNRGVTPDDIVADPVAALKEAAQEWASLPGSPYGQPTKTEEECRQKFQEFNDGRKAKESTSDTGKDLEVAGDTQEFSYYYAETLSASTKAFLDTIAWSEGTYELGDESYFNDPQNSTPLTDLNEYPGYRSGRYNIDPEMFEASEAETFTANAQDEIAIYILENGLNNDAYSKIASGNINEAMIDASEYWTSFPGGDNNTKSNEEFLEFYNSRLEFWTENTDNPDQGIIPDNDAVSTDIGGEKVFITIVTDQAVYSYQYILVDNKVDGFPIPVITFTVQSIRYALAVNESNDNFEDVNPLELVELLSYKYNIPVINRVHNYRNIVRQNNFYFNGNYIAPGRNQSTLPVENPGIIPNSPNRVPGQLNEPNINPNPNDNPINLENKDRVEGEGKTDLEIINEETENTEIIVTEDNTTGSIVVTAERLNKAKRIIINEILDISFEDRAVVDEDPLYPVRIESILNDSMLDLKPEDDVTINDAYSLIPDSLKNDVWIVMAISHNILQNTSTLELLKYVPIEDEETTTGSTVAGGGILTLDQIHAKWDNSIVKVGNDVASGAYASGWIVSEDGYILSAAHMQGMTQIGFKDGTIDNATQVDIDQAGDMMLLKIDKTGLTPISLSPDTSHYDDGSDMVIHSIGHPNNTQGGHDDWRGATSKVLRVEQNGYAGLSGKTLVTDDSNVDFAFNGNSGCPHFNSRGNAVSLTSGGQGQNPDNSDGQEVWGTAVENIHTFLKKNNVNYVTGSNDIPTPSGSGDGGSSVNNRPGGVYPGFFSPSDGVLTSGFGRRNAPTAGASTDHKGVDIAAGCGQPIYAAHSGTVMNASDTGSGHGIYVALKYDADPNIWTMYGHCQEALVSVGDTVQAGQEIAKEGTTGVSTGCHLHFEVRTGMAGKSNVYEGTAVDPLGYIPTPTSAYSYTDIMIKYGKSYNLGLYNDRSLDGSIGCCISGQQLENI